MPRTNPDACSVWDDPDCHSVSPPNTICTDNCGASTGTISFASPVSYVSIYAESGPNPDLITHGTVLRAYDASDNMVGEVLADSNLQFDLLAIRKEGIVRCEISSPREYHENWDELSFETSEAVCDINADGLVDELDSELKLALLLEDCKDWKDARMAK